MRRFLPPPAALPLALALAAGPALAAQPAAAPTQAAAPAASADCPALLRHVLPRLQDERPHDLCQYRGSAVLVVNTASLCGYTRQYEGLEALHTRYHGRGLVVLGFPSNDFGSQEPGSSEQIAAFCENTFGVRFPMFVKTAVRGKAEPAHPLFEALAQATGERPGWNFHKYLISPDGREVLSFASKVEPLDPALLGRIERWLPAPPR